MKFRTLRLGAALAAATFSLASFSAAAQQDNYPSRPITMVMPYAAGGPGDTITRLFAGSMQKILGQTIVVDNTAGASGSIGTTKVARAKPDGYTLLMIHVSHATNRRTAEIGCRPGGPESPRGDGRCRSERRTGHAGGAARAPEK